MNAESRIFDGQLLVRKHSIFPVYVPKDGPSNASYSPRARFFVCPHLGEASWKFIDRDGSALKWQLSMRCAEQIIEVSGEGSVQCKFCVTECRVNSQFLGDQAYVYFTGWQTLGEGRSNLNYHWLSHLDLDGVQELKPMHYPAGNCCAAFEGGKEFKHDSVITLKDMKRGQGLS